MYCIKATLPILLFKIRYLLIRHGEKKMKLIYLNSFLKKETYNIVCERGGDHVHAVRYYFNLGSFSMYNRVCMRR